MRRVFVSARTKNVILSQYFSEPVYGAATVGGEAPTASTSFQIDSLTKAFTAFAVLRLYEEGKIPKLTDPIGKYMTDLPNPAWAPIQVNQLLAMVSGIPDSGSATQPYTESLQSIAGEPLMFAPGSQYFYSNSNYFLLGQLVDTVAGSYRKYVHTKVLNEFGMPDTELIPFERATDPATPYMNGAAVAWRNPDCGYSAGGFASRLAEGFERDAFGYLLALRLAQVRGTLSDDGFRRDLTGTEVRVAGEPRPVVGTISMDAFAVELERDASGWITGEIAGVPSMREGKVVRVDRDGQRIGVAARLLAPFFGDVEVVEAAVPPAPG